MADFAITLHHEGAQESCALCGRCVAVAAGPRLVCTDSLAPVCQECGRRHAPPLAALLDLTRTAERVGSINRHTLVPPLEALLDLAHAAGGFTDALSIRKTADSPHSPLTSSAGA
jgi:hypothetical protein